MFRIFKRKRKQNNSGLSEKAASKIRNLILKVQTRFAVTMSRLEERLSMRQKKIALAVFCLFMGSLSSYWLYQGIFKKPDYYPSYLKQKNIIRPEDITLPDSLDVEMLEDFKRRLEAQKHRHDSIKN